MTPAQAAVEVYLVDEEEVRAEIARVLEEAGVTLEELREQAEASRFRDESARLAWFVVSPFVADSV